MRWTGINALQRKFLEQGSISPRAWRKQMSERGLLDSNAINRGGNARKFPSVSRVKASNKGDPRRNSPENSQTYGSWYSGRAGRP
jgi:hypothetical protein